MGLESEATTGPFEEPGMELHGKYVFIGEGVRGSLAKKIITKLTSPTATSRRNTASA